MAGYDLLNGPCGQGKGEVHILFTHFHWDHLIGLPFFTPIFIPGNEIHVYAVQPELPEVFRTVFKKPYFPLNLEQLGAKIHYHRLEPRAPARIGELTFTPYQLDHPDPCWGYKFEADGRKFSYCVDTEATRVTREEMGPDLPLYQDLDLLVFDAQYTLMEAIEKVNWGHAAAAIGIDIALREKVKKVLFMHHDPASSDSKIAAAREQTERYLETQNKGAKRSGLEGHALEWDYAREGLVTDLKEPTS
jgi:phosphoribosyl 1,2-cyclic phosphodiesterase